MTRGLVFLLLFTSLSSSSFTQPLAVSPQELAQLQPKMAIAAGTITNSAPEISITPDITPKSQDGYSENQERHGEHLTSNTLLFFIAVCTLLLAFSLFRNNRRKAFLSDALASGQASYEQMQWLIAVLDNFPGMVLICDANGKPLLSNRAYNDCLANNISQLGDSPSAFISANNCQSDECVISDKYYRISREVVRHNDGHQYHITVFADFTELKQRKQELKLSQQQAVEALKARESFLAIISHELRTPLTAMIGLMELLKPELKSSQNLELMQNAQTSAERLKALVNDLLDFSKMEANQLQLDAYQGNIFDEVGSMLRTLEAGASVKGLDFRVDWQPTIFCHAELDWLRLSQIVNNLVGNAIKFTKQGSVKVSIANTEQRLYLSIEDSGCGMTQSQLLRLFQPFVQGDPSINRNYGGTGLGMSIVKHLVQLMGGEINVESRQGHGTLVCVNMPVKFRPLELRFMTDIKTENDKLQSWLKQWRDNSCPSGEIATHSIAVQALELCQNIYPDQLLRALSWPNKSEQADAPKTKRYTGKVLVADDDPINRFLFQKQLKKLGLEVVTVNDGQEALNYLAQHSTSIDLLLTDCHMPNLNGYDLVRQLRARSEFKALAIIGCTAEDSRLVAEKAQSVGMDEIIYKPYTFNSLSDALGRYCQLQAIESDLDKLEWLNAYEIEEQLEFSAVVKDSLIADKAQLLEQSLPLTAISHRIKGAANTLNLTELASLAYACETVSSSNAPLATKQLIDEIDAVIAAINNWLSKQYL